ncbi:MAG TPA: penicillin-binding protein activator LpoB [Planctomycetaceae bacterium]|nr:penicillin-binding protein activator LpoB [Planctomycetaceae bacterium]HIQ20543.1 penicillin-binding protein activator LpoB [Planctomycetota bacterium]
MDGRFGWKMAIGLTAVAAVAFWGCRGRQTAQVLAPGESDMVGSHAAGAETFKPLVEQAVTSLLARHAQAIQPAGFAQQDQRPMRVCFVGVENRSIEEIGDFKEQIYQMIDTLLVQSPVYQPISRRFVEAGLRETRLRPDQLFVPENMRAFMAQMEQLGQPFEYLLYATITSGTTRSNADYQRDYMLTLEMINVQTGHYDKESAHLRKGYNVSPLAKLRNLGRAS